MGLAKLTVSPCPPLCVSTTTVCVCVCAYARYVSAQCPIPQHSCIAQKWTSGTSVSALVLALPFPTHLVVFARPFLPWWCPLLCSQFPPSVRARGCGSIYLCEGVSLCGVGVHGGSRGPPSPHTHHHHHHHKAFDSRAPSSQEWCSGLCRALAIAMFDGGRAVTSAAKRRAAATHLSAPRGECREAAGAS